MIQVNSFEKNAKKQSFDTVLKEKIWIESNLNSVVSVTIFDISFQTFSTMSVMNMKIINQVLLMLIY